MLPRVGNVSGTRIGSMPSVRHIARVCTVRDLVHDVAVHVADQSNSAGASRHRSPRRAPCPASSSPLVSVRMPSRSPTHSSWCSVAGAATAADSRCPSGCPSARPSTIAAAPEPSVSVANCARTSSRVASRRGSRSMVLSWISRGALAVHHQRVLDLARVDHRGGELHAVEEAQAGVRDVEVQAGASAGPARGARRPAADGSRCARLTDVLISRPTWAGSTPASASAFAPAIAAASANVVRGPPAALVDARPAPAAARAAALPGGRSRRAARRTRPRSRRAARRRRRRTAPPCSRSAGSHYHSWTASRVRPRPVTSPVDTTQFGLHRFRQSRERAPCLFPSMVGSCGC